MKIGHPKNFWGGVMFIVIGLIFAVIARGIPGMSFIPGYTMGTPARMGPGFFPFYLGMILFFLGVLIALTGLRVHQGDPGKIEKFHWGPVGWVIGAIVIFGLLLKPVGMLLDGGHSSAMAIGGHAKGAPVGTLHGGWRPVATYFGVRALTVNNAGGGTR